MIRAGHSVSSIAALRRVGEEQVGVVADTRTVAAGCGSPYNQGAAQLAVIKGAEAQGTFDATYVRMEVWYGSYMTVGGVNLKF